MIFIIICRRLCIRLSASSLNGRLDAHLRFGLMGTANKHGIYAKVQGREKRAPHDQFFKNIVLYASAAYN